MDDKPPSWVAHLRSLAQAPYSFDKQRRIASLFAIKIISLQHHLRQAAPQVHSDPSSMYAKLVVTSQVHAAMLRTSTYFQVHRHLHRRPQVRRFSDSLIRLYKLLFDMSMPPQISRRRYLVRTWLGLLRRHPTILIFAWTIHKPCTTAFPASRDAILFPCRLNIRSIYLHFSLTLSGSSLDPREHCVGGDSHDSDGDNGDNTTLG